MSSPRLSFFMCVMSTSIGSGSQLVEPAMRRFHPAAAPRQTEPPAATVSLDVAFSPNRRGSVPATISLSTPIERLIDLD